MFSIDPTMRGMRSYGTKVTNWLSTWAIKEEHVSLLMQILGVSIFKTEMKFIGQQTGDCGCK